MLVHELNPMARIVMRVNNSRIARRLDGVLREVLGDTLRVIDPFEHAAPQFVEAVGAAYDAVTPGTSPSPARNPTTAPAIDGAVDAAAAPTAPPAPEGSA